jgi:hypothetical protein
LYVAPDPAAVCDPLLPAIHEPRPPCDAGRAWLLDDPQQYGVAIGQPHGSRTFLPSVLNPLLPVDVPFATPATWQGGSPVPQPVIVLGHFDDNRVTVNGGNLFFVVDALAWSSLVAPHSLDSIVSLTDRATEAPDLVLARAAHVSPNKAIATWATVINSADFAKLDPDAAKSMPEFTTGAPVWIVRRLIRDAIDGPPRIAIEWAWTADHGSRVWWTETPDSPTDLGTTLDLHAVDARTDAVRVFDYDDLTPACARWRASGQSHGRTSSRVSTASRWPEDARIERSRFAGPRGGATVIGASSSRSSRARSTSPP